MTPSKPRLWSAAQCDSTDPKPGVRLVKAGEVAGRLTPFEALSLAGDLIEQASAVLAASVRAGGRT